MMSCPKRVERPSQNMGERHVNAGMRREERRASAEGNNERVETKYAGKMVE